MNESVTSQQSLGLLYAFTAYLLWGFTVIYFLLLAPTGPIEVVAWRVLLTLVVCVVLVTFARRWRNLIGLLAQPRVVFQTVLAGVLIFANWQLYVVGTLTGHVVETSLGFFITPVVSVLLGVFVLGERLRSAQWIAVGIVCVAVAFVAAGYASFPWLALGIAVSFGLYGLLKKQIGSSIDPVAGLTLETLWVTPVAVAQFVVIGFGPGISMGNHGATHTLLLCMIGVVTAAPLLLFAAGASRVPLSVIGFLQFVAPITQFSIGVWILGEPMSLERWLGFALVWFALLVVIAESLGRAKRAP